MITDAWLRAYGFHFATPADCAGPIGWAKEFATGAHRLEAPDEAARRAVATRPALAIWGMEDRTLHPEHFLPLFSEIFSDARVHCLPGASHYTFEDAPQAIAASITAFLKYI